MKMTLNIFQINFRSDITEISALDSDGVWSPEIMVFNIPWKIRVYRETSVEEDLLAVFLYCDSDSDLPKCSYKAVGKFRLLSFNSDLDSLECSLTPHKFKSSKHSFGFDMIS